MGFIGQSKEKPYTVQGYKCNTQVLTLLNIRSAMYSIENFYYILYQHLLKPLNLQDCVYKEFGSVEAKDIVRANYHKNPNRYGRPKINVNSCYFLDQEPIQASYLDDLLEYTTAKHCKILINSEISDLKKQLCRYHGLLDCYYFFHGFAALDWYRDGQYFDQSQDWSRPYISMNRLHVNDRSYRLNLVARLQEKNLLPYGHVSLHTHHTEYGSWQQEIDDPNTKLSDTACQLIAKYISDPLILDQENTTGDLSAAFGHREFDLWKSGLWHIVTETVFYYNKLHLTEKIFKPIVAQRPFLLAAAPGNLAYLKSYGFKTFDTWIDESYDNIVDNDQRLQAIVDQVYKLCSMSDRELRIMHSEMMPVLEHNFTHLYSNFKQVIVNELVDNFENSVRLWNNGRVDDRQIALDIDFDNVKKLLLG